MNDLLGNLPTQFKLEVSIDRNSMVFIAVTALVTVAALKFLK